MKYNKFYIAAVVISCIIAGNAISQTILPKMPSGPAPKAPLGSMPIAKPPTVGEIAEAVRIYRSGDYTRALALATILSQRGDANAMVLVGFMNENGLGVAPSASIAEQNYRRAIVMNNEDAMVALGRMGIARSGGIAASEAYDALSRAAAKGRDDAASLLPASAYNYAIVLDDGEPAPDDDKVKAAELLRQAAIGGIAAAQTDYGLAYYFGSGVEKNLGEAAKWFEMAANNQDMDAAFYWALVNAKGEGVPKNLAVAYHFAAIAKDSESENKHAAQWLWQQLESIRIDSAAIAVTKNKAQ